MGIEERDQWMKCMKNAMQQMSMEESLQQELLQAFFKTADFMRNRED
ncbi:MAG: hypothetical protein B6D71_14525 [gamma proteobacterium symbiont of Stewartia floridana]|nr:MAG: hypothetical protein B6D71_14525 [gamma proteobacterium symbiont of Stewartia floridana]